MADRWITVFAVWGASLLWWVSGEFERDAGRRGRRAAARWIGIGRAALFVYAVAASVRYLTQGAP